MEQTIIRVLVADDHPLFRQGLRALFANESDIRIIDEAVDGAEAISKSSGIGLTSYCSMWPCLDSAALKQLD